MLNNNLRSTTSIVPGYKVERGEAMTNYVCWCIVRIILHIIFWPYKVLFYIKSSLASSHKPAGVNITQRVLAELKIRTLDLRQPQSEALITEPPPLKSFIIPIRHIAKLVLCGIPVVNSRNYLIIYLIV